jgi:mannose-6-phosphate isomerase-like protein (cupin superfamily)
VKAIVLRPGEGERLPMGGLSVVIKATGDDTAGTFYLGESEIPPGFQGPPPHVHEKLHDMFLVIEGTLTIRLGEEEQEIEAGTFVCVPPGVVHTFSNRSEVPVKLLNFNTPAGWENYMRELAVAASEGRPLTPDVIGPIASKYDFRAV